MNHQLIPDLASDQSWIIQDLGFMIHDWGFTVFSEKNIFLSLLLKNIRWHKQNKKIYSLKQVF